MTGSFVSWPWIIRIHTEFNSMLGQCWIVFHECWVWNHEKEIKLGDIPTLANSPWNQPLKFLMECWLYILEGRVISYLRSGWLNQQHWEIHSAKAGFRKSPMRIQYMKLIIKDWNHSGNITLVDKVTALRRHFFYWVPHPRRPVLVSVLSPLFMTSIERNKEHDGKGDNSISLDLTRRTICAMNV